jgi:hypothetical protein
MECQNCGHKFFMQGQSGDMVQDATCPNCHEPYLNQPSPTHSEMEMRNMPAPGEQDTGGNPLQEGILADGGWQNRMKRDESFASVKTADSWGDDNWDDSPDETHRFIVTPGGQVHSSPVPATHEEIATAIGHPEWAQINGGAALGRLFSDGSTGWYGNGPRHPAQHLQTLLTEHFGQPVTVDPNDPMLGVASDEDRWGIGSGQQMDMWERDPRGRKRRELDRLWGAPKPRFDQRRYHPGDNEGLIRGGGVERFHAEPSWLVSSDEDLQKEAAQFAPLALPIGRALLGHGIASGISGLMKGVMGQGGSQPPAPQAAPLPDEYLSHTAGPLDHPSSIDGLGAQENDPEAVDQHEVNDGDMANPYEPGVNGEGGTDEGALDLDLSPETAKRLEMLLPLLIEYYNSPHSGQDDPLVKALHESIEAEHPGYLDSHTAAGPPMPPVQAQPGTGVAPAPQPQSTPPTGVNPVSQGHCAYCGATMNPGDTQCPQCQAATAGGGIMPQVGQPQAQPQAQPGFAPQQQQQGYYGHRVAQDPTMVGSPDATMMPPEGAPMDPSMMGPMPQPPAPPGSGGTQGPQTKEQFAAVAQYLVDADRADEIPNMLQNPDQYAQELAEIQNKQPAPEDIQSESPDPTAEQLQAPSQIPPATGHTAADNMAPRCPVCGSGTTGLLSEDGDCGCHACGHTWNKPVVKSADRHDHDQLHPHDDALGVPAADQVGQDDPERSQDSSHIWQDDGGAPLQVGREYEMASKDYDIPDIIRIEEVKPDSIEYSLTGEYNLSHRTEVTAQEAQMDGLSFTPIGTAEEDVSDANTDSYRGEPTGQTDLSTPAFASTKESVGGPDAIRYIETDIPAGMTVPDYRRDRQLENAPVDVCPQCGRAGLITGQPCPHCGYFDQASAGPLASTKEAAMSTCGDCNGTRISVGPNGQPRCQLCGSFNIADTRPPAVPNDLPAFRAQPTASWLDDGTWQKEAGKKYTPMEQREFIDEGGDARNKDKLDLKGTHYEAKQIPDDYFLFGL